MNNFPYKIILISILLFINLTSLLYAIQADVENLSNDIYLPRTLELNGGNTIRTQGLRSIIHGGRVKDQIIT